MTKKQKTMLTRLLLSGVCFVLALVIEDRYVFSWVPFIAAYLLAGYDIPLKAARNLMRGQIFDENFLMTIATFGAIFVGSLEEAVAVMLFYQVGELFSDYAVNRSRRSITELMDINPEYANLLKDGEEQRVDPYEVEVGDTIIIKPGEKVPLDGVVVKGASSLDAKALTGESMPVEVTAGDEAISGSINVNGVLEVRVTKLFDDSAVSKILELVENASSRKARAEAFITRFARVYTPIVVFLAVILAIVPPLITGGEWSVWIYRACSFLVVSCPCALVISVPLSFFGGLGAASRHGILLKGSNYLEAVSELDTVVFDKTGTLTTGEFRVAEILPVSGTAEGLLKLAAYGEYHSGHPIADSIKEAYGQEINTADILSAEELSGHGIHARANVDGTEYDLYLGNRKLMDSQEIAVKVPVSAAGTVLYLADGKEYKGALVISDTVKADAADALKELRRHGVGRLVMLTGDKIQVGQAVAEKLGLDQVYGDLLPGDKVDKLEALLTDKPDGKTLAYVGDGINDAPVLARADVGIAMGGIGSDAAIEAADVVIMDDDLSKISDVIRISRKTMTIVKQNIIFAIGVKILVLILVAAGHASMWAAVFGDVGVSVLAILNAIRALAYKRS